MIKIKNKINSFTIGFKDKSYDESQYVKKDKFNKNLKKILTEKDFIETFKKIRKTLTFHLVTHLQYPHMNFST